MKTKTVSKLIPFWSIADKNVRSKIGGLVPCSSLNYVQIVFKFCFYK